MKPNPKIFGTDGVRGTANVEPVTAETALKLGRAAGHVFKNLESQPRGHGRHKIVIGKDTRLSGYMFESALASGIVAMGADVWLTGPLPTPGIAFITSSTVIGSLKLARGFLAAHSRWITATVAKSSSV